MKARISFTKMVGAGNDFLVVDTIRQRGARPSGRWTRVSRALCDRRAGVGADGLLVLEPSRVADAKMRVFNPDGSEAKMCGNGARCVARFLHDLARRGNGHPVVIETAAGMLRAGVHGQRVSMRMPAPTQIVLGRRVRVGPRTYLVHTVNTGVPHAVIRVAHVERVDVQGLGRALRHHPAFGWRGTNVDFIEADAARPDAIRIRTYERGVEAETPACGTGVAAAAIIHALTTPARQRTRRVRVRTRSRDELTVTLTLAGRDGRRAVADVILDGPARRVFDGTVELP